MSLFHYRILSISPYSLGAKIEMAFVELEGNYFNTEDIEAVRPADTNGQGFRTEVLLVSGMQLLRMTPEEAIKLIKAASE